MQPATRRLASTLIALALLGTVTLTACKRDEPAAPAKSTTTTSDASAQNPPAETPATSEPEPTETPATPAAEKDGRYLAYLKGVKAGNPGSVVADYAQFLTGDAALAEAKKRGMAEVPNDYLIVNDNPKLRTIPLAPNVTLVVSSEAEGIRPEGYTMTLSDFAKAYNAGSIPQFKQVPFWLTIKNGAVTRIEEQYLP